MTIAGPDPEAQEEAILGRRLPRVSGAELRRPLQTEAEALNYAKNVICATESPAGFEKIAPYVVADEGDTWAISGTNSMLPPVLDPVRLQLRKSDAAVLSYLLGFMGGRVAPQPKGSQ